MADYGFTKPHDTREQAVNIWLPLSLVKEIERKLDELDRVIDQLERINEIVIGYGPSDISHTKGLRDRLKNVVAGADKVQVYINGWTGDVKVSNETLKEEKQSSYKEGFEAGKKYIIDSMNSLGVKF